MENSATEAVAPDDILARVSPDAGPTESILALHAAADQMSPELLPLWTQKILETEEGRDSVSKTLSLDTFQPALKNFANNVVAEQFYDRFTMLARIWADDAGRVKLFLDSLGDDDFSKSMAELGLPTQDNVSTLLVFASKHGLIRIVRLMVEEYRDKIENQAIIACGETFKPDVVHFLRARFDALPSNVYTSVEEANIGLLVKIARYEKDLVNVVVLDEKNDLEDFESCMGELVNKHLKKIHSVWKHDDAARELLLAVAQGALGKSTAAGDIYAGIWRRAILVHSRAVWDKEIRKLKGFKHEIAIQVIREGTRCDNVRIEGKPSKKIFDDSHCYFRDEDIVLVKFKSMSDVQKLFLAQPIVDIGEALPLIQAHQQRVAGVVLDIAMKTCGAPYLSGRKSMSRVAEKAAHIIFSGNHMDDKPRKKYYYNRYQVDHNLQWNVWDLARGCLSYPTLTMLIRGVQELIDTKDLLAVNVGVNFQPSQAENTGNAFKVRKWQDVKVMIVFPEYSKNQQLICEIQFALNDFVIARKSLGGHAAYSEYRTIEEVLFKTRIGWDVETNNPGVQKSVDHKGHEECRGCDL